MLWPEYQLILRGFWKFSARSTPFSITDSALTRMRINALLVRMFEYSDMWCTANVQPQTVYGDAIIIIVIIIFSHSQSQRPSLFNYDYIITTSFLTLHARWSFFAALLLDTKQINYIYWIAISNRLFISLMFLKLTDWLVDWLIDFFVNSFNPRELSIVKTAL